MFDFIGDVSEIDEVEKCHFPGEAMKTNALLAALLFPAVVSAQSFSHCESIISTGLRDYQISTTDEENLVEVFDRYCDTSGSIKRSAWSAGLGVIVEGLPFSLTGGSGSSEERFRSFCKNYAAKSQERRRSFEYSSKIVAKAYDAFNKCVELTAHGVSVSHSFLNPEMTTFFIAAGTQSVQVRGVVASGNITCEGRMPNGGKVKAFNKATVFELRGSTANFSCSRKPRVQGELKDFLEGTISVQTSAGNYDVFLPQDAKLPQMQASAIQARQERLENIMGQLAERLDRANARVSSLRLETSDAGREQFGCGQGSTRQGGLTFMDGTIDGTGCGVANQNFYKTLRLSIPEDKDAVASP